MPEARTILFVDDMEVFRGLGRLFLAHSGRVITASSGEQALEIARREHPDIILLDLLMPGLDGDVVCRSIKNDPQLHDIPVIMLVGANSASHWGRAVRAGADDVLAKPITSVALVETVHRFTQGATPQGLPRIPVNSAVQLQLGAKTHQGSLKNLSRGGLFVETECGLVGDREVGLRFALPGSATRFDPTAQVVWKREALRQQSADGVGMRFVDISSDLVRKLEEYVFDRAPEPFVTMGQGATA